MEGTKMTMTWKMRSRLHVGDLRAREARSRRSLTNLYQNQLGSILQGLGNSGMAQASLRSQRALLHGPKTGHGQPVKWTTMSWT